MVQYGKSGLLNTSGCCLVSDWVGAEKYVLYNMCMGK
jgi:hypothetical protein